MLETTQRCSSHIRDDMAIIGTGKALAQTALVQRQYMYVTPLGEAIYCAYEAKRYAQRIGSVGDYTTVAVYGFKQPIRNMDEEKGMVALNEKYETYGPQQLSTDVYDLTDFLVP